MCLYVWNVKGINKPLKQSYMRKYIGTSRVDICCLVKTRVKQEKAQRILRKIAGGYECFHNYATHYNGRIWVLWNPNSVSVVLQEQ